ncbi:MAG: hypothetical protein JSV88_07705, partial [Candidatus Aminicenantes bacterium]
MIKRKKTKSNLNVNKWYRAGLPRAVIAFIGIMAMAAGISCVKSKPPGMAPEYEEFYKYAHYLFTKNEREIFAISPPMKQGSGLSG